MKCSALKLCGNTKRRAARRIFMAAILAGLISYLTVPVRAQANATTVNSKRDTEEKNDCARNLKLIYAAIQAYKVDHRDLPNWLSDLVPQYLTDTSLLICPTCKRTGETETSALADPKVPSSYTYQFSPVPLAKNPDWTWREWKRRQMGLIGSAVPLLRCQHHGAALNVSFDGRVYESDGPWESLLTNQVNLADLAPERIFANDAIRSVEAGGTVIDLMPSSFPPRDSQAKPNLIDLTSYYNVHLTDSWISGTNNTLASLPVGTQTFADVMFDVRGVLQLAGKKDSTKHFPTQIKAIRVQQKCARLHFLQASAFGNLENNDGREVGLYVAHLADKKELNIPIVYGRDLSDWFSKKRELPQETELTVAWVGDNPVSDRLGRRLRLFASTWVNPSPEVEIDNIDFISHADGAAPFLLAITAD